MRTRPIVLSVFLAAGVLLSVVAADAGSERTNVRGMGMARTYVAGSRGLDAVGINPANLAAPDSGTVTMSLIPFGVHAGTDMMTYGTYKEYFTGVDAGTERVGRYLTDADKQKILEGFPDGVGRVAADAQFRPIGLSINVGSFGRFAFTITEQVAFDADIPHDYAEFILYGNAPGSVFDFSATRGRAQWTREYALSFGRAVPVPGFLQSLVKNLNAGVAVKYVQGFAYYEMSNSATSLATGMDGILHARVGVLARGASIDLIHDNGGDSFTPFPDAAGSGMAFDLGVSGMVTDYLTVGIAVTDIGSIGWTKHLEQVRVDTAFTIDDPGLESQRTAIENAMKGTRVDGEAFSTNLPTKLRIGVAVEVTAIPVVKEFMVGQMDLAADYNQGLYDVPGSTTRGRFSLGMEYRIVKFFPLRFGVSFGGEDRSNLALGFGLHFGFLDMDFGSENLNFLFAEDNFSKASLAMGLKLRF